ncbi:DUF4405 domain-containing protein [Prosthecochloris sp. ZM_2]|uniref:DUF4405 domain-containing protein n=1 Tax=Prosthecochloris sp. ZM_2 TaxID=2045206 RepID=UPI000DF833A6|nr:DUF4405 domain-containing protein [Prosthecochloris sp. ZM_2]RNA64333.1 DUF4405 domain-containing protein [Prosthecochloris sp. ZM_2]
MKKKTFSWRAFISLGLLLSFLVLLVSGVILYLAPAGRIANWTDWQILGLTKKEWQNQHTVFSLAFAILSIFHLFSINWKAFWSYLKSKTRGGLAKPAETISILLLFTVTAIGTWMPLPPFSTIVDVGDNLTDSWEQVENQPPVPHMERLTLRDISTRYAPAASPQELKTRLEDNGISVISVDQTLEDIAGENGRSAEKIFSMLGIEMPKASRQGGGRGQGKNR